VHLLGLEGPVGCRVALGVGGGHGVCLLMDRSGTGRRARASWRHDGRARGVTDNDTWWASASGFPVSRGARPTDPRLPRSRLVCNVPVGYSTWSITRGTPPRLEGCRPASRGLTLALMTETNRISPRRLVASRFLGPPTAARRRNAPTEGAVSGSAAHG
jgi:hypothetical protein